MLQLEHRLHEEFANAPFLPFITELTGDIGDKVRSAGGSGAGNVTYVQIFDGGYVSPSVLVGLLNVTWITFRHMAPHDQPEATLVSGIACFLCAPYADVGLLVGHDYSMGAERPV